MIQGQGFFYELRRRHVVRVAIAYAVAAWVLLQLASILFPTFGAPDWVLKVVVAILALGFPVALILAWAFEMTPEGIRRTEPAHSPEARPQEVTRRVGKQLNAIIIAVLALVVVLLLADRFLGRKAAPAASAPAPGKSIAVLPFENLSDDKSNGYFATGMQDEILTRLAGIHALKVISRTSTEKYASHPTDLKTVGRELDVASVLEGSVQKAGDKVHINVQLIDTGNDDHLWAQSYDRDLKDIFAVERDVAQSIADALKATLQPQEKALVDAVPTKNPAAYDLYLRAIEHFNRARDQDVLTATEMPQAIALFEQSLAADARFALVAALAGEAHMFIYFNGIDRGATRLAAAKAAIDRALAVQPDLGEAHFALALYHYYGHRDYASALQELDRAQQSLPNSAYVAVASAAIARRQGRWSDAIAGFQRAALFDPRSSAPLDQLGLTYAALRRYADADQAFSRSVSVSSDPADERVTQAINTVRWKGDLGALRTVLQELTPGSDAYVGNAASRYQLDMYSQDYAAAAKVAESDPARAWGDQGNIVLPRELYLALAYASMGEKEKARSAYARVRSSMAEALVQQPDAADLHLALGLAAAGLASKDDALREGRRAAELMPPSRDNISGAGVLVWLAQIEAMVGEPDAAFDHLRQALALPSGGSISPAVLKLDPAWDALRKDPRFDALLEQGESAVSVVAPHG